MRYDRHNLEVAAAWASRILETRNQPAVEKKIQAKSPRRPFRFFALNDLAPIADEGWAKALADQTRLAAHAIISALDDRGHTAYWARPGEAKSHGFSSVYVASVDVTIDYRNYDASNKAKHVYDVSFELILHLRWQDSDKT